MTRDNLLETLGEDYIRTARAKGLSERQVIFKHGLRASLTPIVTMFGLDIALLVGGAVITESVFNIQGLGYLAINGAPPRTCRRCSASSCWLGGGRVMNLSWTSVRIHRSTREVCVSHTTSVSPRRPRSSLFGFPRSDGWCRPSAT